MRESGLGEGTGGVWTAAQARAVGLSPTQVRYAVTSGRWQVLRRGVYLDAGVEPGPDHRAWAAVASAGGPRLAVAAGRTAARLHGLPLVDDDDPATGRRDHVHDDVAVRRPLRGTTTLHPHRWAYGPGELGVLRGCPTPSLARTLWDCRGLLRPDALVCAVDAALHTGRVSRDGLTDQVRAGAREARAFRQALAATDGRAESPLETLARLALLPVLPELEPQVEVRDAAGRLVARIDLGVRGLRLGVEADGRTHRGEVSLAADRARERRTGWTLERVTWWEVRRDRARLQERVATAAARLRAARAA